MSLVVRKTKILPPFLVLASMLIMLLLDKFSPLLVWYNTKVVGTIVLVISFLIILYCAYLFHNKKTAIKPFGESTFLILAWPYTMSRNPIYLSMTISLLGWGLWLQSLSVFLIVPLFMLWLHYRFVLQEEIMLTQRFKDDYMHYKNRVRRWV